MKSAFAIIMAISCGLSINPEVSMEEEKANSEKFIGFLVLELKDWKTAEFLMNGMDATVSKIISDVTGYSENSIQVKVLYETETDLRIAASIFDFDNPDLAMHAIATVLLHVANHDFAQRMAYDPFGEEEPQVIGITETRVLSSVPTKAEITSSVALQLDRHDESTSKRVSAKVDEEQNQIRSNNDDSIKAFFEFVVMTSFIIVMLSLTSKLLIRSRGVDGVREQKANFTKLDQPLL